MKLIKILSEGKPEGGFPGLAAVMLSFGLALAAAGGMVLAGCESPAGVGNGYDGAVSPEAAGAPVLSAAAKKTIKVRFDVRKVGIGLRNSRGIVSTQDDSYLRERSCGSFGTGDFTVTITVPASDEYLNIRWWVDNGSDDSIVIVNAKMKAESGTITLDYNDYTNIATENLYDVRTGKVGDENGKGTSFFYDWVDAVKRACGL